MQLQVKLQKSGDMTYLQGNKQQTGYRFTYLDLFIYLFIGIVLSRYSKK